MRPLDEREQVLNMYFHEGMGYKGIASITGISLDTVKSWCRRYRIANGIPKRGKTPLSKDPVKKPTLLRTRQNNRQKPYYRLVSVVCII